MFGGRGGHGGGRGGRDRGDLNRRGMLKSQMGPPMKFFPDREFAMRAKTQPPPFEQRVVVVFFFFEQCVFAPSRCTSRASRLRLASSMASADYTNVMPCCG